MTTAISRELMGKIVDEVFDGAVEDASIIEDIYACIKRHENSAGKFSIGDLVRKKSGSWWEGYIVGTYSTHQTPNGCAVQLDKPNGPVQIYPETALELVVS